MKKGPVALALGWVCLSLPAAAMEKPEITGPPSAKSAKTVSASLEMERGIQDVRVMLADARATIGASPDVLGVQAVAQDGCERVEVATKGLLRPLHYVALRCPQGEGFTEDLVESDDFSNHHIEWELAETDTGTRVTVRAHIVTNLPVPQAMVDSAVQSSLVTQLKRIKALLGR